MKGVLYVVATPIGNLSDLSERAKKVLSEVDFIAAEDTRVTGKLLMCIGTKKPLISYHEHNKREKGEEIIKRIKDGESCAIVSDAGTPAISDPGEDLVRLCAEDNIPVYAIPGPCAVISALSISGLPTGRFSFEGFLSTNKGERKRHLEEVKASPYTLIFYEAPHKLRDALSAMLDVLGDRRISLVRELTKINEEVFRTTLSGAVSHYAENNPKGEFVLVLEGAKKEETEVFWESMDEREHVEYYMAQGMEKMDAIKATAKDRGVAKSVIYKKVL
ncbi:MAG: 16S rRNA (cytidine(1402)-2'-O)-methyltransferase [Ruminococcaceae bacterium]|nr:16S rRNA (cytidine(1402)-2'-O)-methyltransferase [Oscillospiraceae bacterium]